MKEMQNASKNDGRLDVLKFVLSLAVVAIHSSLYLDVLYPWVRLAVPLFFIMTGYFLFGKLKRTEDAQGRKAVLKGFVKRNLLLYLTWFILLSPVTFYMRDYFREGVVRGLVRLLRAFLFASTFRASWYIMACVIGALIVYGASRVMKNRALICVFAVTGLISCLTSAYLPLVEANAALGSVYAGYQKVFSSPATSFFVSLFYLACGKCFAEGKMRLSRDSIVRLLVGSCICLYGEWRMVARLFGSVGSDCYFFLMPTAVLIFALFQSGQPREIRYSRYLRECSVVIYALHASLCSVIDHLVRAIFHVRIAPVTFAGSLAICLLVYLALHWLRKRDRLRFLRWAY